MAEGLAYDVAARRHAGEGSAYAPGSGPAGNMLSGVADLSVDEAYFGHVGLFIALVKVGPEGVAKRLLPFSETFLVATQHLTAELDITGVLKCHIGVKIAKKIATLEGCGS